jgi:hypothetical protein
MPKKIRVQTEAVYDQYELNMKAKYFVEKLQK